MKTYGWPRPPIIISVVLGGIVEKFYGIASLTYGRSMFTRLPVLAIISLAVLTGGYTLWIQRSVAKNEAQQDLELANLEAAAPLDAGTSGAQDRTDAPEVSGASGTGELNASKIPLSARFRPTVNGVFLVILFVFFAYFFIASQWCGSTSLCTGERDWPISASRLPLLASTMGLLIAGAYLAVHLFIRKPADEGQRILDIGRSKTDASREVIVRRTIKAIGTTVGFVFGIWLLGFQITVPAYIFLYLWYFGGVRWWYAALGAVFFIGLLYGFFDGVIHVIWPNPVLEGILPEILTGQ